MAEIEYQRVRLEAKREFTSKDGKRFLAEHACRCDGPTKLSDAVRHSEFLLDRWFADHEKQATEMTGDEIAARWPNWEKVA